MTHKIGHNKAINKPKTSKILYRHTKMKIRQTLWGKKNWYFGYFWRMESKFMYILCFLHDHYSSYLTRSETLVNLFDHWLKDTRLFSLLAKPKKPGIEFSSIGLRFLHNERKKKKKISLSSHSKCSRFEFTLNATAHRGSTLQSLKVHRVYESFTPKRDYNSASMNFELSWRRG